MKVFLQSVRPKLIVFYQYGLIISVLSTVFAGHLPDISFISHSVSKRYRSPAGRTSVRKSGRSCVRFILVQSIQDQAFTDSRVRGVSGISVCNQLINSWIRAVLEKFNRTL